VTSQRIEQQLDASLENLIDRVEAGPEAWREVIRQARGSSIFSSVWVRS
jgi:hypothetical protein